MKEAVILEKLLSAIKEKLPPGKNMATALADILCIGKEAVYRRLRGEVAFSFYEVAVISEKLLISLSTIVGESNTDVIPFYFTKASFAKPHEEIYYVFEKSIREIAMLGEETDSEVGIAINMIPQPFISRYVYLTRLRSFKWKYQQGGVGCPFSELQQPEEYTALSNTYVDAVRSIKTTYMILDPMIFHYMVNDITYFSNVNLIKPHEVREIKRELFLLIDEMERYAINGMYDNGNKFYLYVSNINFESTYSYTLSEKGNLCSISIFTMNVISSVDEIMFHSIREWIQALKRLSVQISETGEMARKDFFRKQRELISML